MQAEAQHEHSRIRPLIGFGSITCLALALVGYIAAEAFGDNTEPYDDGTAAIVAWDAFMLFGAAAVILGVTYALVFAWQETRRG